MIFRYVDLDEGAEIALSARVVGFRRMGNVSFGDASLPETESTNTLSSFPISLNPASASSPIFSGWLPV